MNVLLITFSFPPAGGVGVLRALSFAKYFPLHGVRLDVLTARNAPSVGKDPALVRSIPNVVTVHHSWTLDLPFAVRKGIKELLSSDGRKARPSGTLGSAGRVNGNPLRRALGNLLLPDPQVGWLPFASPAAAKIIRSRDIDAVLITVPPFSSVRLVTLLRRTFPSLPIFLDFRDEWLSTTMNYVSFDNSQRARSVAYKAEADSVRDATVVVAVTESARQELIKRYPYEDVSKFKCIPNGFELPSLYHSRRAGACDQIVLTYVGSVYRSTDPSSFVEAVLALSPTFRDRLLVRFIGHIETAAYRALIMQLGATVQLLGFLPREQALCALEDTDYLLLITHDPINISAKLYDYLSSEKPILAVVHPEGEARRVLEETGTGVWAGAGDPLAIKTMLEEVLREGAVCTLSPNTEEIAKYDRKILARHYADLLKSLGPT